MKLIVTMFYIFCIWPDLKQNIGDFCMQRDALFLSSRFVILFYNIFSGVCVCVYVILKHISYSYKFFIGHGAHVFYFLCTRIEIDCHIMCESFHATA